jgi:arabinose-5-phosphate isomerase
MALLEKRGFREEDFARLHPGGKLGKKWLRVGELMHSGDGLPLVDGRTSLLETVFVMSSGKLGVAVIVDGRKRHRGVITDGDLRRMIEKGVDFTAVAAGDVMSKNPAVIEEEEFAVQALRNMENRSITSLLVTDRKGRLKGLVHMHDLLKAGIV